MASCRKVCAAEGDPEATRGANYSGRYVKDILTTSRNLKTCSLFIFTQANQNLGSQLRSKTFNSNMLLVPSGQNASHGRMSFTSTSSDPSVGFITPFLLFLLTYYQPKVSPLIHLMHQVPYLRSDQTRPTGIMSQQTTASSNNRYRRFLPSTSSFLCASDPSSI